jgi:cytochrome c6
VTARAGRASIAALSFILLASAAQAADVTRGRQVYGRHCAGCHGAAGVPVVPGAPNLSRPEALMRPDAVLATAIRNGKLTMPGFRGVLQENEIYDVIAFMRTLLR